MAQQNINRGGYVGDPTADNAYTGAGKINDNFTELYGWENNKKPKIISLGMISEEVLLLEVLDRINSETRVFTPADVPIEFTALRVQDGVIKYRARYRWKLGPGTFGATGTPADGYSLDAQAPAPINPDTLETESNVVYVDLGTLLGGDYLTAANSAVRDFSDPDIFYYLQFNQDDLTYLVQFVGANAVYNGTLVATDFSETWNSGDDAAPSLQTVTDVSATTTNKIKVKDPTDGSLTQYGSKSISRRKGPNSTQVIFEDPIETVELTIPAKAFDDTFAMVSDLYKTTNTVIVDLANVANVRNDQSSVIKLSNGNLVAVYSHFGANPSDSSTAELWASQSSDDGLTWSDEYLLIDDIELGSYIPSFYKKSNGNILMLFFVRISPVPTSESKLYKVEYNSDMTSIVSAATEITMPTGYYPIAADRLFYDEANDKLLMPYPKMVSGTGQSTESIYESRLLVSDDEGDTWADAGFGVGSELLIYNEYGGASEPGLYYTPESGLVMYFRTVLGQLKATKLTYSAGYSNTGSIFDLHPANNACPAVKYVEGKGLVSLSVRALDFGEPSSRLFMDLWTSVDGINFTRTDFVDFAISPYVVNNPTLYVSEDNNYFMAVYGKTMTNSSWTSLVAKKYSAEVFDYWYSPKYKNGFAEDGRGYIYNGYQIKNRRVSPTYSVKVQNPLGGSFKSENNPETGAIAITLPNNDNTYLTIKGTVYDNTDNSSLTFEISCNASDMAKNTVVLKGQRNLSVRFVDASRPKIFIGELSTTWAYPSVTIDEISAHNDASLLELCEGWVIGIEASSFGTVVSTKTDYTQATLSNKATKGGDSSAFSIGTLIASAWNWLYNGTIVGKIGSAGISLVQGFGISNDADSNRFTLSVGTNAAAAKVSRNTATAVAAFRTENANAASTGDIHEFANSTGVVSGVRKDGRNYGSDGTASNDYITKQQADLKADLVGGKVPASQLPGYVDDVEEYADLAAFPVTGESGKLYVAEDTNLVYRWSGSVYAVTSTNLALGETSATAYRGDRGKTAYDHSQDTSTNPHATTFQQILDADGTITAASFAWITSGNEFKLDSFDDERGVMFVRNQASNTTPQSGIGVKSETGNLIKRGFEFYQDRTEAKGSVLFEGITIDELKLSALNTAPASATDTGTTGEIRITSDYIYICIATDTWVRSALTTW